MATVGPTPGPEEDDILSDISSRSDYLLMFCVRPTSDGALAGISRCRGTDSIRRSGDVVSPVLYDDGVAAHAVGDIGHPVCSVPVVVDHGLLGFTVLVLMWDE